MPRIASSMWAMPEGFDPSVLGQKLGQVQHDCGGGRDGLWSCLRLGGNQGCICMEAYATSHPPQQKASWFANRGGVEGLPQWTQGTED